METLPQNLIDVWVVEDNDEYRDVLVEVINSAPGMKCSQSFVRCEQAIAALEAESPPQVLLMDIGLPGMSGIEGIQPIKLLSPSTAIIMLTVYEDNQKIFRSLCAGASGHLLKKSPGAKIVESIREAHEGGAPMTAQIARIERWSGTTEGDVHWRSISKDNILTLYGKDAGSRIVDPEDPGRIFSWLICETRDDKGNAVIYRYKAENGTGGRSQPGP